MLKGINLKEKGLQEGSILLELEPAAVQVLHELVFLIHNCVGIANQDQQSLSASRNDSDIGVIDECEKRLMVELGDDPVAKILWGIEPRALQYVFLTMAVSLYSLTMQCLHISQKPGLNTYWYFKMWF